MTQSGSALLSLKTLAQPQALVSVRTVRYTPGQRSRRLGLIHTDNRTGRTLPNPLVYF